MFYVREKPWHGLGTEVQEAPTSADALVYAGLDWEVIQKNVYTVGVHHHQIGSDLVPGDDVAVGHPGQHPDLAAALQGPGSLIGHTGPQQIIGELESVLILDDLVAVRDDTEVLCLSISAQKSFTYSNLI